MKSIERFFEKVAKAALKANPQIRNQKQAKELFEYPKEPSNQEHLEFINWFMSDQVSLINKLWRLNGLLNHLAPEEDSFVHIKDFLLNSKVHIEGKINKGIEIHIKEELKRQQYTISHDTSNEVHAIIQNVVFFKINETKQKFEPEVITELKRWFGEIFSSEIIFRASRLVRMTRDQVSDIKSITLNYSRERIPFSIREAIVDEVLEQHQEHDDLVNYFNRVTQWGEQKTRVEYSEFLEDLATEIDSLLNASKTGISRIYEILYNQEKNNGGQNKQRAYRFIYHVLAPWFSEFHSKNEFDQIRQHATHDPKAYRDYIKSAVRKYFD